jgi:hypothetical protein
MDLRERPQKNEERTQPEQHDRQLKRRQQLPRAAQNRSPVRRSGPHLTSNSGSSFTHGFLALA